MDTFFLSSLPATTTALNGEIERINAIGYGSYNATSTTSLTVGTGTKSLTLDTAKGFVAGQTLLIASTASPSNWMSGQVASYDSGTGALVINATAFNGSGTIAAWTVSVTAIASTPTITQRTITGADTLIASDQGKLVNASGTFTLSVTAAATLGNGWFCYLRNTSNGDVTVDPNAAELIDGAATYVLKPGFTVLLTCTGTAIDVLKIKERTYTNIASYTASGTFVVPADTYVIRGYAFGSGAPGTATEGGAGGGCAYGDIAVTPGESVTVGIASGVATVTTAATARLTGNNAVTTTGGTATKHASVTNGGAYSGGNSTAGGNGGGGASGSPLGVGGNGGTAPGGAAWGGFAGGAGGGGGVGQAGGSSRGGDSLRNPSNLFTDPLLAQLTGAGGALSPTAANVPGGNGGPGGGGGCAPAYGTAGNGGIGAGGGGTVDGTGLAGAGGFGGGNGRGADPEVQMPGGGGGGCGNSGTKFGAACVLIYY